MGERYGKVHCPFFLLLFIFENSKNKKFKFLKMSGIECFSWKSIACLTICLVLTILDFVLLLVVFIKNARD